MQYTTKTTTAIQVGYIADFIHICEKAGMRPETIVEQLKAFCKGDRGIELHDYCARLIDGIVEGLEYP